MTSSLGGRFGWRAYASILKFVKDDDCDSYAAAEHFGASIFSMRRILTRMVSLELLHISGWVKRTVRGGTVPVYAFGKGVNAWKPDRRSGYKRDTSARHNRMPELVQMAVLLRAMDEPISKGALAELSGSQYGNIAKFIEHCRAIGLVRIADWQCRVGQGGQPAALFAIGSSNDEPKPKPIPRKVVEARSRRARVERAQQMRIIQALAANSPQMEQAA